MRIPFPALFMLSFALLAACQPAATAPDAPPAADPTREPILASDLLLRQSSAELTFRWSAPPEAALEPKLFRLIRNEAEQSLQSALSEAKQSQAGAKAGGFPFRGNEYRQAWTIMGETPTLITLSSETYTFTGGAHGNLTQQAILFDRKAGSKISFGDLFTNPTEALGALTPAWCKGLDAARAEKRGKEKLEGFSDCPPLADQVIVPEGEGQISGLRVLVDPYVAGPWAEGAYAVDLPVDSVQTLLKPAYSKDFLPS